MSINPYVVIPEELVIASADDLLYSIGLCLTSVREQPKRRLVCHPILILVFWNLFIAQRIISVLVSEDNTLCLWIVGEMGRYFKMKLHWNVYCIFLALMITTSQLNYFYHYMRGIEPNFLRVFHMLSGSVSPASVGLYDEKEIRVMCQRYKKVFTHIKRHNDYQAPVMGFLFLFVAFLTHESLTVAIFYGIPNALVYSFWAFYNTNIVGYQFTYFAIICRYLKIRLKVLNKQVVEIIENKRYVKQYVIGYIEV